MESLRVVGIGMSTNFHSVINWALFLANETEEKIGEYWNSTGNNTFSKEAYTGIKSNSLLTFAHYANSLSSI